MAERRAGPGRRGLERGDSGNDVDVEAAPFGALFPVEKLEDHRRQGVDAGVARGYQGDGPALRGEVEGAPHPRLLRAQPRRVAGLAGDGLAQEAQVEVVADHVAGGGQRRACLRTAPPGRARADAHDVKGSAAAADGLGIYGAGRAGDGAGRPLRLDLGHDQRAVRAGGGERRALGHPVAAGFPEHDVRGIEEARGLRLERGGVEKPGRDAQLGGKRMDRRLVRLEVDGGEARHRLWGKAMGRQGFMHQAGQRAGVHAAFRAHPDAQHRGVEHQLPPGTGCRVVGHAQGEVPALGEARAGLHQPAGVAGLDFERHRRAGNQRRRQGLDHLRIADAPALGRLVEGQAKTHVTGRRDRGRPAQGCCDGAGKRIGAVVAAQDRHGDAAVLGHRHHRRLGALVGEQRGQRTDQNADGAQADDRDAALEQPAQVLADVFDDFIRVTYPAGQPVDARPWEDRLQPPRDREPTGAEHHQRRADRQIAPLGHRHASPRTWTSTIEK